MSFVKSRPDAPPGFFEVEAAGLRWLSVAGGVPVAEPLDVSAQHLTTPRLAMSPPTTAEAEEFGRRLAATHDAGARYFGVPPDGWDGDGYIGTLPLPHALERVESWGTFYANLRLRPYLKTLGLDMDELCARLEAGVYDDRTDVHAVLFGGGYTAQAVAIARRY